MAETPTKIHYPTNADTFDPAGDMEQLARTVTHIVPVDNAAERNALADAYQPSAEQPLFVYRADSDTLERHAGDGWATLADGQDKYLDLSNSIAGWTVNNYALRTGNMVTLQINMNRTGSNWSGTLNIHEMMPALPPGWRPVRQAYGDGRAISSLNPFQVQVGTAGTGTIIGYSVEISSGGWLRGQVVWPWTLA